MKGYRPPVDEDAVAHNFRVFAEADCVGEPADAGRVGEPVDAGRVGEPVDAGRVGEPADASVGEPLYAALSHAIAGDAGTIALTMQAPYPQRRPVLLFAAVHDLLLDEATPRHPLARFYRSVVDEDALRTDVDEAMHFFVDFCRAHRDALVGRLTERATQTNEVGRCAGLRLALATLPVERPLALIDVGCSAGLNLLVDRYRYEYRLSDGATDAAGPAGAVVVRSNVTEGRPPALGPMPAIGQRFGIDRSPLDVRVERDARWLRACTWPSDIQRHERLAAAIALARDTPPTLIAGNANERLPHVLAMLDPGHRPVLFHSWVVSYFDRDARRHFADAARSMVVERDGVWISAESLGIVPGLEPPALPDDASVTLREATVWHVTIRQDDRAVSRCIARSHPHCRWIEWLDRG